MRSILLAGAAILGLAGAANAVPITAGSTLNIVGSATFTSTHVNSAAAAGVQPGTGDFAGLGTCLSCATVLITSYTYSPTQLGALFSAVNNGLTAGVAVTSGVSVSSPSANELNITDNVTLTLTGKDPTPGQLFWTINQATGGISGSFSATGVASAVPEPMGLALLGTGLLGLAAVRYRRR
jgi:hypothetical protein